MSRAKLSDLDGLIEAIYSDPEDRLRRVEKTLADVYAMTLEQRSILRTVVAGVKGYRERLDLLELDIQELQRLHADELEDSCPT